MKSRTLGIIFFYAGLVFLSGCALLGSMQVFIDDLSTPQTLKNQFKSHIVDSQGTHWALFISDWYGYHDFWLTSSSDGQTWRKPIFTTVAAVGGTYKWIVKDYKLGLKLTHRLPDKLQFYYFRKEWYALEDSCVLSITELSADSDNDGLTDWAEFVLHTDPQDIDTDGDGKADGYDQNPLAAANDSLSMEAALHKQIIEWELGAWDYKGAVLVEQFDDFQIEYKRDAGIILCMPSDSVDAYLQEYGYGIPVLTANIEPYGNEMFKATFILFITPSDAEGWGALFKNEKGEWTRKKTLEEWTAEE